MKILPVLDVMNGAVVRGVGGRRREYRPIVSRLTRSTRPVDVARAFHEHFGLQDFYLADLDAVAGAAPALSVYAEIQALGFRLWIDAGIREVGRARCLADAGVEHVIIGLETIDGPEVLANTLRELGGEHIVFSLDLRGGMPLGKTALWKRADSWSIAEQALALGVRQMIVLDLTRVGVGEGIGTEALCARLTSTYPDLQVIAGGGIRDVHDLERLRQCSVRAALVASALHDGRLAPADVKTL